MDKTDDEDCVLCEACGDVLDPNEVEVERIEGDWYCARCVERMGFCSRASVGREL